MFFRGALARGSHSPRFLQRYPTSDCCRSFVSAMKSGRWLSHDVLISGGMGHFFQFDQE